MGFVFSYQSTDWTESKTRLYFSYKKLQTNLELSAKNFYSFIYYNIWFHFLGLVSRRSLCPRFPTGFDQQFAINRTKQLRLLSSRVKRCYTLLSMASANSRKALSILMLALALVSRNLMPCSLAMVSPLSLLIILLSSISHLFPKIIFSTSSLACFTSIQTNN